MSNEDYIKEYPHLFKDDIDKWLFTECSIMGGACSSIESLRYSVARGIAEKLWRDDAPRKPIKVYRVENEAEEKGLWRKFDGTWEPLFDMLTDGKCKDMPMDDSDFYRRDGKQWFSATDAPEKLTAWFDVLDVVEMEKLGYGVFEIDVKSIETVSPFEVVFTRDQAVNARKIDPQQIWPDYLEVKQKRKGA